MFEWVKRLLPRAPVTPAVSPDDAMARLCALTSDAAFEDAWDAMDSCAGAIEDEVRAALREERLGEYPAHAAAIWLGYTLGKSGRTLEASLHPHLARSVAWALRFDENTVLLGAALGALDALEPPARERLALDAFDAAGADHARRYWLLLKVRTRPFLTRVVAELQQFEPPAAADGDAEDPDFAPTPTAVNRMAGAFRQFEPEDFEALAEVFDLDSPGAQFLVDAIGSTRVPRSRPYLERALDDPRPAVQAAGRRWLERL